MEDGRSNPAIAIDDKMKGGFITFMLFAQTGPAVPEAACGGNQTGRGMCGSP